MENFQIECFVNGDMYDDVVVKSINDTDEYQEYYEELDRLIINAEKKTGLKLDGILNAAVLLTGTCMREAYKMGMRHGNVFSAMNFLETFKEISKA